MGPRPHSLVPEDAAHEMTTDGTTVPSVVVLCGCVSRYPAPVRRALPGLVLLLAGCFQRAATLPERDTAKDARNAHLASLASLAVRLRAPAEPAPPAAPPAPP